MFAEKVTIIDLNERQSTSNFNPQKNRELNLEINKNKLNIDYSCFSKTPYEKELLKLAKASNKVLTSKNKVK